MFKHNIVKFRGILVICFSLLLSACINANANSSKTSASEDIEKLQTEVAIFAGGCFWCTEADFEKHAGVIDAVSGYIGGDTPSPTYKQVSSGKSGHIEAVSVTYDPNIVSYEYLLEVLWRHVDPTDSKGQFVDRGPQYRPAIFYKSEEQKRLAKESIKRLESTRRYKRAITVELIEATKFWPAEEYHQNYYKKNPLRYKYYRYNSGRDQYLEEIWGDDLYKKITVGNEMGNAKYFKPADDVVKSRLSKLQYKVTQKDGTEKPFDNEYWDEKREGIYVDIVSGEPLFSSRDKFDSGTGWPSFSRPLVDEHIVEKQDYKLFMRRTEVRSHYADSHLGHVFDDGPAPTGLRYCINSASLRFIPKSMMEAEGYGEYLTSL